MENGWIFAFNSSNIKVVIPEKLTWNEEDWKCNVCQSPKKGWTLYCIPGTSINN